MLLWLILSLINFHLIHCKNVLLIIADDAGFEAGVFGNKHISTPNLDYLGTKSLNFKNAFTPVSSCSPSRSTILTGLPTHQNGMYGLHHSVHNFDSFASVRTLPWILKQNKIRTGIIGKKHVGPENVYPFDFSWTEEDHSINKVGRNISFIAELSRKFLNDTLLMEENNFFLYVAFHDPHRCGHSQPKYGEFCEHFGNGNPHMGTIPDWKPIYYHPNDVEVPKHVPDTPANRLDIAAQYTTISRLDQGIGLLLKILDEFNVADETLIIYSSDNGIPFPNGRTNVYDSGIKQPFLLSSPFHFQTHGKSIDWLKSLYDITPTILDWFNIDYPDYYIFKNHHHKVDLIGETLLPLLDNEIPDRKAVFGSHNLHEVTMYYPMRYVRTHRYKLIHNLNFQSPFPIDQDFYISRSFQDILYRTLKGKDLHWIKTLKNYYNRDEWELYDLKYDKKEIHNVANKKIYKNIFKEMKTMMFQWQNLTDDPWLCGPHYVLENRNDAKCMPLFN